MGICEHRYPLVQILSAFLVGCLMEIDKCKKVLVTGANGFIGRNLCTFLKEKGYSIRAAVRGNIRDISGVDEYIQVGNK